MNPIIPDADCKKILSLDMVNPETWAANFIEARMIGIVDRISRADGWGEVLQAAISAKINPEDKKAIVLNGLKKGILKTASQKQTLFEAQQATGVRIPETQNPVPQMVDQEVIKRKLALIGASDVNQLADRIARGTREAIRMLKIRVMREWTKEEQARAEKLEHIESVLDSLERTGQRIKADIASGKIKKAEKIISDKRWPPYPVDQQPN